MKITCNRKNTQRSISATMDNQFMNERGEYLEPSDESSWILLQTKEIVDWDGFVTQYSLWSNGEGQYGCFFGDTDLFMTSDTDDFDAIFDDRKSAQEWFDNFHGYADDDEE